MKHKSPKDSIFHDFTKNESGNQEETINFYKQSEENHIKPTFSSIKIPNNNELNDFSINCDHDTYKNASTSHPTTSPVNSKDAASVFSGSGHTYQSKEENRSYLYGFTNSKFIYFLGTLEPRAYLIFVTLISLLILEDLNETEAAIIFTFLFGVAGTMEAIIEQQNVLSDYNNDKFHQEQGAALQKDFDTLYTEINQLKKEISQLKS